MYERIIGVADEISTVVSRRVRDIERATMTTKLLALNAAVEAAQAGAAGTGFAAVAKEVRNVSDAITGTVGDLQGELKTRVEELNKLGDALKLQLGDLHGQRLADLALNMIDVIDRNLYERSCDVRWWATDSAVVECAEAPASGAMTANCSKRLGVILDSYTVYLDLWVMNLEGRVIANGRPAQFPNAVGQSVADTAWFKEALGTADGSEFAVADITANAVLDGRLVATYSAAIREGGEANQNPVGVLGIFFDWQTQSQTVVNAVRLSPDERPLTRCLLLDRQFLVIAASDTQGVLTERYALEGGQRTLGHFVSNSGAVVGFARTPGYETYKGLGWYGAIEQRVSREG